jgi:integrase/recombinase XerC
MPAVWALAEATATTHEIPRVQPEHVDVVSETVLLPGSAKIEPRTSHLTDWGVWVLSSRLATQYPNPGSLTYEGRGSVRSMQASSSMALARVLRKAGLRGDSAVKPESVRAWAGRRVWADTGRIEAAALALGSRSLDTAAGIIGYQWADPT